ncbi:deoxycytidylate deaminase [Natribacillus halophilus]|uniref:Cytidine and deoxycytidylate deaminase zinc-binding region n=1 Tax=Natribacillus halophilus TaxID=549003 RepID=A0A1G8RU13_9BACI|nr:deaminase [Natribacillus halophilus]SDJ20446.1 Cytidine and deoxycytidylate deaminase zinc-binding region [Natribacillus halophilus]
MDKCAKLQVRAVIVKDGDIIAEGRNSPLRECDNVTCHVDNHCVNSIHAEQLALIKAGRRSEGATMFTNFEPCSNCRKMIISAGIKTVIYHNEKYDELNHRFKGDVEWIHDPLLEGKDNEILRV